MTTGDRMGREQVFVDRWNKDYWGIQRDDKGSIWHKNKEAAAMYIRDQIKLDSTQRFRIRDHWGGVVFTNKDESDV